MQKGQHMTDEMKDHLRLINIGKHPSEETRKKMSDKRRGSNHPLFGTHRSEETKRKIRDGNLGKKLSEETRKKISAIHKGVPKSDEHKKKISVAHIGIRPNEETRQKISNSQKGRIISEYQKQKIREWLKANNPMWNPEYAKKISGSNSPAWKGGISFGKYCPKFNKEFKERVREFWGRKCFICGIDETKLGYHLHVHHVNYDKTVCCNNSPRLFIPLCNSCHGKTTHADREGMAAYLTDQILLMTDGQCYLPKVSA